MTKEMHFNPDSTVSVQFIESLRNPGPRKTANPDILRIEHELINEGTSLGNPAEPLADATIPDCVHEFVAGLETDGECAAAIEDEGAHGPRKYVVALLNQRREALDGGDGDA